MSYLDPNKIRQIIEVNLWEPNNKICWTELILIHIGRMEFKYNITNLIKLVIVHFLQAY